MPTSWGDSIQLTVVAMGIVFVSLFVLFLLMSALPVLVGGKRQVQKETATKTNSRAAVARSNEREAISKETVVVIASAIAAYLGRPPQDLNIIAIRRDKGNMSPWAVSARRESVQNL